ncbi:HD-GYP domain-containing protein [Metabacillus idriensis]|uniref:HD-GYP domain-containing protein n=1 Tax=Metabacillus idriensis TaxID=324768 RepID=UPI002812AC2A|nr:HD-GYP domain-containing protein [Metabacillus idriensis]MDR0136253.1 HD-GYP domain-containing protein [Metabacillus idriensis]
MEGLHIFKKGSYINTVKQQSAELSLLLKNEGTEILFQSILKDRMFYIYPGDKRDSFEFYYIIKGEVFFEENNESRLLKEKDYFYVQDLKKPIFFKALTDVELLWFITEPAFDDLSDEIEKFTSMVQKVEHKDRYTYNHSMRVQEYSIKIAKELGLDKRRLENLYIASLLHDIGKINVQAEILNKPDKLTDEEFSIIKKHPIDGAEILKHQKEVSEIILQHHEKLDGSGYPFGLKSEEILLESKIVTVSDTYDAMTQDRVYRNALRADEAVRELKKWSGIHFDQEIVNTLISILQKEGKID